MATSFDHRPAQLPSRRLRIAFVSDTFAGSVPSGGVAAGQRLVAALRQHHEVVVVSADASGPGTVRLPSFQLPLRAMRAQGFVMARPDRRALDAVFESADVVHLQFPFWLSMVALERARRAGCAVVAAFHVQPENALHAFGIRSSWLNAMLYRWVTERFYNRADAVICPSRFARLKLRAHGLVAPAFIISNGVPPDVAHAPTRIRREGPTVLVMAVGRLAAEKRHELLIEAVRRSRHRDRIRLVIAGTGPREDYLRRKASSLPFPARIGYLPRHELINLLSAADLFVHCSDVELEGIAVLEAMSLRVPVLVADSPESAASGLALDDRIRFPSGHAEALASRLDGLLERPALLREAAALYQQRARTLDFQNGVDRVVDTYRFVLGQGEDRTDPDVLADNDPASAQPAAR